MKCLIALGSNRRPRATTLRAAIEALRADSNLKVTAMSRFHRTRPIGGPKGQGGFLNGALVLETSLPPGELWKLLKGIEGRLGRQRGARWGARRIDLDLLLYGEEVIDTPDLIVPHRRMAFRRFVLEPAAEVAAEMVHPTSGWTVGKLLNHLETAPNYVAICGPPGAGKTRLAERLAGHFGGRLLRNPTTDVVAKSLGPAGWSREAEIELVSRRAETLSAKQDTGQTTELATRQGGVDTQRPLAVSDFWIEQSRAYARAFLSEEANAKLEADLKSVRFDVTAPKLILALTAPTEKLYERNCGISAAFADGWSAEQFGRLCTELERLAGAPGHGPVLRLDATQEEEVWNEAVAAIEAMH